METPTQRFYINDWHVDPHLQSVSRAGTTIRLEQRQTQVLLLLVQRAGEIVGTRKIEDVVWGGSVVSPNTLHQAITQLRRSLGDDAREPRYIQTIARQGYRLIAKVKPESTLASPASSDTEVSVAAATSVAVPQSLESSPALGGHWWELRQWLVEDRIVALSLLSAFLIFIVCGFWLLNVTHQAEQARARADELTSLMINTYSRGEDRQAAGSTTVQELTANAARRIRTELEHQPQIRATLLLSIASSYTGGGLASQAIEPAEEAVATRRRFGTQAQLAEALAILGHSYRDTNRENDAARIYGEALQIYRDIAPVSRDAAVVIGGLGIVELHRGRPRQALEYLNESLTRMRAAQGMVHSDVAAVTRHIAMAHALRGEWEEAERRLRDAIDMFQRSVPPQNLELLQAQFFLGDTVYRLGRTDEAAALLEQVLAAHRKVYGSEGWPISQTLSVLADVRFDQGRTAEAEKLKQLAMDALVSFGAGANVHRGDVLESWASKLMELEQFQRGEQMLRKVKSFYEGAGQNQRYIANAEYGLAESLLGQDKNLAEAKALLESSATRMRLAEAPSWYIERANSALGEVLYKQGNKQDGSRLILSSQQALRGDRVADPRIKAKAERRVEWLTSVAGRKSARVRFARPGQQTGQGPRPRYL